MSIGGRCVPRRRRTPSRCLSTGAGRSCPRGDRLASRTGLRRWRRMAARRSAPLPTTRPIEYVPHGLRPFGGGELEVRRPGGELGSWWSFAGEGESGPGQQRLAFTDEVLGLRAELCYQTDPRTDVIRRWSELSNIGEGDLVLRRLDSAAVNIPVSGGARLTYLVGQWAQEFQLTQVELGRGGFSIGSRQGVSGHDLRTLARRSGRSARRTARHADLGSLVRMVGFVAHRRAGRIRRTAPGTRRTRAARRRGPAARRCSADHP
jgi:hypothetical protein